MFNSWFIQWFIILIVLLSSIKLGLIVLSQLFLETERISVTSIISNEKWYFDAAVCYISHCTNKTNPELHLFSLLLNDYLLR